MRYLSPAMITKWASGSPAACDSACIVYDISQFYFPASNKRSTPLNNLGKIVHVTSPVTVVALDGVMVLILAVVLTYFFTNTYQR